MNQGDGGSFGGSDGPALTRKVDLVIGVDASFQMERQMEVQQGGRWTGTREGALFSQRLPAWIQRYESLRRQFLRESGRLQSAPLGLSLFIREGE